MSSHKSFSLIPIESNVEVQLFNECNESKVNFSLLHQTHSLGVKEVGGEKGKDVEIEFQSILPTEILASLNQIQWETKRLSRRN